MQDETLKLTHFVPGTRSVETAIVSPGVGPILWAMHAPGQPGTMLVAGGNEGTVTNVAFAKLPKQ